MNDELPDVPSLRRVEPPPGGLAMLRERLDDAARPRRTRWLLLAVPAVAALVLWRAVRHPGGSQRPVATIDVTPPAVHVAPVPDRDVGDGFYWVDSTPAAGPARGTPVETVSVEQRAVSLPTINP